MANILPSRKPFEDYTVYGPIYHSSEQRNMVVLVPRKDGLKRSSTSYARYLLATHLGRRLSPQEQVDHINNIKNDDRIENLQILSPTENLNKSKKKKSYVEFACNVCGSIKRVRKGLDTTYKLKGRAHCSRQCAYESYTVHQLNIGEQIMTRQEIEALKCAMRDEVTPAEVYGRLMDPGYQHREKNKSERMDILFNSLESRGMEVVGFGYPHAVEKYVGSDLETIAEGSTYHDFELRYPRLIVRPKPPKKYRYVTDGNERLPVTGDYINSLGEMVQYTGAAHQSFTRMCFTREEVKD